MASVERVPTDHYGEALATLVAEGAKNPEMVAAVIAAVAESLEDTLNAPRWISLYVSPATFTTKEPPPC
jgi:ABC-type nitrate/sulfonate/bicarbonate transport system substrate-binding protein